MPRMFILAMATFSIAALAQDGSIEVGGAVIQGGMTKEAVSSALRPPYGIECLAKREGAPANLEICLISGGESWDANGEISFEDGRVTNVTRNLGRSDNADAHALFSLVNEALAELTSGNQTCAMVYTYSQEAPAPESETAVIVLPEKFVTISTVSRGDKRGVAIQESLRINPVPASYDVDKGRGERRWCVMSD